MPIPWNKEIAVCSGSLPTLFLPCLQLSWQHGDLSDPISLPQQLFFPLRVLCNSWTLHTLMTSILYGLFGATSENFPYTLKLPLYQILFFLFPALIWLPQEYQSTFLSFVLPLFCYSFHFQGKNELNHADKWKCIYH